jgi:hypothetical protein
MSRDYTLLAKLGFADPDKQDPTHDAACRYLAQPEVAQKLWALSSEILNSPGMYADASQHLVRFSNSASTTELAAATVEAPISKGSGQYKTTIGFMDVVLYGKQQSADVEVRRSLPAFGVGIEVKHTQKSIHDAVRQINLYREYTDNPYGTVRLGYHTHETQWTTKIVDWYLATTFDITQQELEMLSMSRIKFIRLGADFNKYLQKANTKTFSGSADIVL